jgi:2-polyprenyl-6-methoxyphenol hydroxylase-like FAD-dependent oxidoreductase
VTASHALAVQARTLEFYRQIGIAEAVVERGRGTSAGNFWVAGKSVACFFFRDVGADLSPFPYPLIFPQTEHERSVDCLAETGVQVERGTERLDFEEAAGSVFARLKRPDGTFESCEAAYIAGCDGAFDWAAAVSTESRPSSWVMRGPLRGLFETGCRSRKTRHCSGLKD